MVQCPCSRRSGQNSKLGFFSAGGIRSERGSPLCFEVTGKSAATSTKEADILESGQCAQIEGCIATHWVYNVSGLISAQIHGSCESDW